MSPYLNRGLNVVGMLIPNENNAMALTCDLDSNINGITLKLS